MTAKKQDAIEVQTTKHLEWLVGTWFPYELRTTNHARRKASLRRGLATAQAELKRREG